VAELDYTVQTIQPQGIFTINYLHGTAEFCARHQVPFRCWEIDPATDQVTPFKEKGDVHIFTYRQAHVAHWLANGYGASYLPLASNPTRRTPGTQQPQGIAFVGTSMVQTAETYAVRLVQLLHAQGHDEAYARSAIEQILSAQSHANSYVADTLFTQQFPDLPTTSDDPAMLLGEIAASRHRIQVIQKLADLNIDVWGDAGWSQIEQSGVHYKGPAGHFHQLNDIYRGSLINIDIGRIYQSDIVTMRVFDVLACGGFVLAAYCEALAELFQIGQEVDSWKTLEELHEKTTWYLEHPQQAQAISQRGREKILRQHNIRQRVAAMLKSI
jgi:spore maturation protein CgeB